MPHVSPQRDMRTRCAHTVSPGHSSALATCLRPASAALGMTESTHVRRKAAS